MTQPSYYRCSLFEQELKNKEVFSFTQDEVFLKNFIDVQKANFSLLKVEYFCKYLEKIKLSSKKPVGILPIKDNVELLKFTLKNLLEFKVFEHVDFIVVDDRSSKNIKEICEEYPVNYLRVDNKKGFNFSTLNNIAAKIAFDDGVEDIILWNSDLWADSETTVPNLLKLHKENNATISGTRLLYPTFSWNGAEVSDNITDMFPGKEKSYRGTIQFGGSMFSFNTQLLTYFPNHFCRFKEKDYYLVKVDKLEEFVTGAFQIINLKWFIETGGMNPSMSKVFQDVDLCLKAVAEDKKVFYFGKDNYLLHDESVSTNGNKVDDQFKSDHVLYQRIWTFENFTKKIQKMG